MRRIATLLGLFLVLPFVAVTASAACQIVSPESWPDINYTTVCVAHEYGFGDGTQEYAYDYVLHARHAAELDPAFTFWEAEVARGTWTYDDGDVQQNREWAQIGSGLFVGARGLVGGGAWFAVAPVGSVGSALYYHQVNSSGSCQEQAEVGLSALLLYEPVPVPPEQQDCSAELPWLYDQADLWNLPSL